MRFCAFFICVFLIGAIFPAPARAGCRWGKRVLFINPPTLLDTSALGYSQISVDTKNAVAYVSGQVSFNLTGSIIGSTLAEQLPVVEKNLRLAMEAVGAGNDDILRLSMYVKDYQQADLPVISQSVVRLGRPVATLISTPALALDPLLVEVEITVAVSHKVVRKLKCA